MDHAVALVQAYLQLVEAVTAEDDRRPHERHPREVPRHRRRK
jgi:hypothetical protein